MSWESIELSWELPASPNGQIIFYEILVEADMESYIHKANTTEYTVTRLSPAQKYALVVSAVNSAGPGKTVNCTAFTLSESGTQSSCTMLTILHIQPQ